MAVQRPYTIDSIVWNGTTWSNTNGGPLSFRFSHVANKVPDRTGADRYATAQLQPELDLLVSFRLRDIIFTTQPGSKSDMVVTFVKEGQATVQMTFADMVLIGADASLDRSIPGEVELSFDHEHTADDATNPVTNP